jgi:DNA-binding CsgD family transcriptional regulator
MVNSVTKLDAKTVLDITGKLYDAAMDLNQLTTFIEQFANQFHSCSAFLRFHNNTDHSVGFNVHYGYDPNWISAHKEYYYKLDPYIQLIDSSSSGMIMSGEPLKSDSTFKNSEYINDFTLPQDKIYTVGGYILKTEQDVIMLAMQRDSKGQAYEPDEIAMINLFVPHLRRALMLNKQFCELYDMKQTGEQILGKLSYGIVLFEEGLKPVFLNDKAEKLFSQEPGFSIGAGRLKIPFSNENSRLIRMIQQALDQASGRGLMGDSAMQAGLENSDRPPINIIVLPLTPRVLPMGFLRARPRVALLLIDPDYSGELKPSVLHQLFGFTTAEARLARELVAGQSLPEIIASRGVSRNTLRSQTKSLFDKTGTKRQPELVKMLAGLSSLPIQVE